MEIYWHNIEADYVEGIIDERGERTFPTLREVAERHEVSDVAVRKRSTAEGWVAKREAFQITLDRERQKARIKALSEQAVVLDTVASTVSEGGLKLIQQRITEITREVVRRREQGEDTPGATAIDATKMAALARAGESWYRLGQLSFGKIPTQRVEHIGTVEVQEPFDREIRRLVREMKEREAAESNAEEQLLVPSPNGHEPDQPE